MSMSPTLPRRMIEGVQMLLSPDGPYIEVAERLRLLYTLGQEMHVLEAETLLVRNRWIYRVTIAIGEQQSIGDAEIHFGASRQTPDGTNPVTCGQTSAIGNALSFAGYGDPRMLFHRLHLPAEELLQTYPTAPPHGQVEGIRVIWFEETPYVPVAERLYWLHHLGHTLQMQRCMVLRVNGVWVYRVCISVDGRASIGDAEVPFLAAETAPERRFPVSLAQTAAVGNALALAGYGDLRTLLERRGKKVEHAPGAPALASADAVGQAMRQRLLFGTPGHGASTDEHAEAPALATPMTFQQREHLVTLCAQLGETVPEAMDDWTQADAEGYIEVLRLQVDDLLEAAQERRPDPPQVSPHEEVTLVNYSAIGALKRAWVQAFGIRGTSAKMREHWEAFKQQYCSGPVDDDTMSQTTYHLLTTAIDAHLASLATRPSTANGQPS